MRASRPGATIPSQRSRLCERDDPPVAVGHAGIRFPAQFGRAQGSREALGIHGEDDDAPNLARRVEDRRRDGEDRTARNAADEEVGDGGGPHRDEPLEQFPGALARVRRGRERRTGWQARVDQLTVAQGGVVHDDRPAEICVQGPCPALSGAEFLVGVLQQGRGGDRSRHREEGAEIAVDRTGEGEGGVAQPQVGGRLVSLECLPRRGGTDCERGQEQDETIGQEVGLQRPAAPSRPSAAGPGPSKSVRWESARSMDWKDLQLASASPTG